VDVEFRVLGPMDARVGDVPLPLGAPKQRTALALLLLHPSRPVTVQRVVDELWPIGAPRSAVANAITYLSRLRRVLGEAGCALERRTGGYVLQVRPGAVDVGRFTSQADLGDTAWSLGEPGPAEQHWGRALAAWRGPAFDGLPTGPELDAARAQLTERRLTVLERHARARLRLGGGPGTVSDLRRHVLAEPLRESGWLLFMAASWFAGNPAAALATYEEARAVLAEQLGVDPGPRLRAMHRAVLTDDDDAGWALLEDTVPPPGDRPARAPAVPAQLPLDVRGFTGRAGALARLDAVLDSTVTQPTAVVISAVSGTAGVGKTALALHWAHLRADRFPDGHLYVNLRGFDPDGAPTDPAKVVRGFLDALGVPAWRVPDGTDTQGALYRSMMAGRRMLVVLDNGRDAHQVRPLLPGSPTCVVLVTSRNRLADLVALDGAQPLPLDLLDPAEALQLLANRLGAARVAAEPAAAEEIVARCARLPLALSIVGARAAANPGFPLAALAGQLRAAHGTLDGLAGDGPLLDVRSVFSWSFQHLGDDAARLFRLLGRQPGPDLEALAAASLAGVLAGTVRPLLAELIRANLLIEHVPGRYTFHDLLRVHAGELSRAPGTEEDSAAAERRLLDHYLYTACAAARLVVPHRDWDPEEEPAPGTVLPRLRTRAEAMDWFATERSTLVATIETAAAHGYDRHARQLAAATTVYFARQGHAAEWIATQHAALDASVRAADLGGQADAHRTLLRAYSRLGRHTEARHHFELAIELFGGLGDIVSQAHTHINLAYAELVRGRHHDALWHDQLALDLYRAAGDLSGQADALNSLGWAHSVLGNHRQTLEHSRRALALLRQIGATAREANVLDSIGHAHHHLGDRAKALASFEEALTISRGAGDRYTEAEVLVHLGETRLAADDRAAARTAWQDALVIMLDIGHPDTETVQAKLHELMTGPGS
jgi:DNA-binding SARP family transcriptional activator/tetratricopeptide (TPR) repeat protein